MRAAHLQDFRELPALFAERITQLRERLRVARHPVDEGDAEGCRIGVVGGLRAVHVIVRAHVLILALLVPHRFERDVRDDLVHVHVGRGARPALDHVRGKLVEKLPGDQPVARAHDRGRDLRVEHAEIAVRHRRRFLHIPESLDEVRLLRNRDAGDFEVLDAAQGLDAVVCVVRNLALTQEILLLSARHGALLYCLVEREQIESSRSAEHYTPLIGEPESTAAKIREHRRGPCLTPRNLRPYREMKI